MTLAGFMLHGLWLGLNLPFSRFRFDLSYPMVCSIAIAWTSSIPPLHYIPHLIQVFI